MGVMVNSSTCALLFAATPRPRTTIEACSGAASPAPTRTDALMWNDRPATGADRTGVGVRQAAPAETTAAAATTGRKSRKDFTVPCSVKDDRITTYLSVYAGLWTPAEGLWLSCGRKPIRGRFIRVSIDGSNLKPATGAGRRHRIIPRSGGVAQRGPSPRIPPQGECRMTRKLLTAASLLAFAAVSASAQNFKVDKMDIGGQGGTDYVTADP